MDYTDVCTGWIYIIINKVNGKMYVGQTIDYKRRRQQHFSKAENCPLLLKAFNKYGKENFKMLPILELTFINKEVRQDVLNKLEQHYIKKYNTYNLGYNITKGAMGRQGCSPSDDTRQRIKEGNAKWWSNEENKKYHHSTLPTKAILQYDLNGVFIREYDSITEAANQFPKFWSALQTISIIARTEKGSFYGSQWRYKKNNHFPIFINTWLHRSSKPVYHYTKEGILIKGYPDAGYAARELGIDRKYIISAVSWSRRHPESKKMRDYWSRESPSA